MWNLEILRFRRGIFRIWIHMQKSILLILIRYLNMAERGVIKVLLPLNCSSLADHHCCRPLIFITFLELSYKTLILHISFFRNRPIIYNTYTWILYLKGICINKCRNQARMIMSFITYLKNRCTQIIVIDVSPNILLTLIILLHSFL